MSAPLASPNWLRDGIRHRDILDGIAQWAADHPLPTERLADEDEETAEGDLSRSRPRARHARLCPACGYRTDVRRRHAWPLEPCASCLQGPR